MHVYVCVLKSHPSKQALHRNRLNAPLVRLMMAIGPMLLCAMDILGLFCHVPNWQIRDLSHGRIFHS